MVAEGAELAATDNHKNPKMLSPTDFTAEEISDESDNKDDELLARCTAKVSKSCRARTACPAASSPNATCGSTPFAKLPLTYRSCFCKVDEVFTYTATAPRDLVGNASGQRPMRQATPRAHHSGFSESRAASRRVRGRLMRPSAPSRGSRSLSQRVVWPRARAPRCR